MELEEKFKKYNITEEGQKQFKLVKALENVTFQGVAGNLIDFQRLSQESLIQLSNIVDTELRWRAIPNTDKGGH